LLGLRSRWNDALLVGVLHRLAHAHHQLQSLGRLQPVAVAVVGDRFAADVLHHEVRPTAVRRAGVVDARHALVIEQRERLALRLEARHHLAAVHPGLDDLERDASLQRRALLGEIHHAETAFAEAIEQTIGSRSRRPLPRAASRAPRPPRAAACA
jgi:hypothetical protein